MAKIKHTKNELKNQRDALKRYERYLPTLQLKKQQLQIELRQLSATIQEKRVSQNQLVEQAAAWISLFSEPFDFESCLELKEIQTSVGNIAGVDIPVLENLVFGEQVPDLYSTPGWIDEGIRFLKDRMRLVVELNILDEQYHHLSDELRTTTQRVNLFEKVKIPDAREHIREIRIFLGDEQTASVARAKIAKAKTLKKVSAT